MSNNNSNPITKIGTGTYSEVYYMVDDGQQLAVKIYKQKITNGLPDDFIKDYVVYHQYSPIGVEDVEIKGNHVYLVMPYYGNNLVNIHEKLNIMDLKNVFFSVLQQLRYLHMENIMHRDIKSENILFNDGVQAMLIDYSIALFTPQNKASYSVYTEWYRPPEVCNKQSYDKSADIWALGMVMLENLCNSVILPYTGAKRINEMDIFYSQLDSFKLNSCTNRINRYIKLLRTALSRNATMVELIYKMITKNPTERLSAKECLKHHFFESKLSITPKKHVITPKFTVLHNQLDKYISTILHKILISDNKMLIKLVVNSLYILFALRTDPTNDMFDVSVNLSSKLLCDNYCNVTRLPKSNTELELEILTKLKGKIRLECKPIDYYQYLLNPSYWNTHESRDIITLQRECVKYPGMKAAMEILLKNEKLT